MYFHTADFFLAFCQNRFCALIVIFFLSHNPPTDASHFTIFIYHCISCGNRQLHGKSSRFSINLQHRLRPQIFHMKFRFCIQYHISENSGKTEKILVFQIGSRRILVHLHSQNIPLLPDPWGQVKIRWSETVLRISHKMTVEPHIHGPLHTLKRNADPLPQKRRFQVKGAPIRTYRVIFRFRKLPFLIPKSSLRRSPVLMALPGIHGVDIVDPVKTRQFHMPRHLDCSKTRYIRVFLIKIHWSLRRILRPRKLPGSVEALVQTVYFLLIMFFPIIKMVIRMCL